MARFGRGLGEMSEERLLLGTLILGVRRLAWGLPVSVDIASYAVGARELLQGRPLYADVWDMKPPGIFLLMAGWDFLAGMGEAQVWALGVLVALLTCAGVGLIAWRLGGRGAGIMAALLWASAGSLRSFNADQLLPDSLMLLGLVWCGAFLVDRRPWWAGVAGAVAVLTKPTALLLVVASWIVARLGRARLGWAGPEQGMERGESRPGGAGPGVAGQGLSRAWIEEGAAFCCGLSLPAMAVGAWLWSTGALGEAWYACVVYAGWFAGNPWANLVAGLAPAKLAGPMPLLFGALLVLGWPEITRRPWWWAVLGAAVAVTALPGKWWPHYYLPTLAALVILAALGAAWHRWRVLALAGMTCALLIWQVADFGPMEERLVRHGRVREATCRELGRALAGRSLWSWGDDQCLYFYAQARPPSGMTWGDHLTYTRPDLRQRHIERIITSAPEVVVLNERFWLAPPATVQEWLARDYEDAGRRGWYRVLTRRES